MDMHFFWMLRHPKLTVIEVLGQRTELSAIVLQATLGYVIVLLFCVMQIRPTTSPLFVLFFPLLWGPPLSFLLFWLWSWGSWLFGKLTKGNPERSKLSLLQSWALSPFIHLFLFMAAVTLPMRLTPLKNAAIPEAFGWFVLALFCIPAGATLTAYFSGIRHLYTQAASRAATVHFLLDITLLFAGPFVLLFLADSSLSKLF